MNKLNSICLLFSVIWLIVVFGIRLNVGKFNINNVSDQTQFNINNVGDQTQFNNKCKNMNFKSKIIQRSEYTILENYIKANHPEFNCLDTITYTTHGDYTFLDNLAQLTIRWMAPISMSIYAPGSDFNYAIENINYLRNCIPESKLIRQFVTFHMIFDNKHFPSNQFLKSYEKNYNENNYNENNYNEKNYNEKNYNEKNYNCSTFEKSEIVKYADKNDLYYPINVCRNVAKDAALTHFILASDVELYPSLNLVKSFLKMIKKQPKQIETIKKM